jgi:hypothetical protein
MDSSQKAFSRGFQGSSGEGPPDLGQTGGLIRIRVIDPQEILQTNEDNHGFHRH